MEKIKKVRREELENRPGVLVLSTSALLEVSFMEMMTSLTCASWSGEPSGQLLFLTEDQREGMKVLVSIPRGLFPWRYFHLRLPKNSQRPVFLLINRKRHVFPESTGTLRAVS